MARRKQHTFQKNMVLYMPHPKLSEAARVLTNDHLELASLVACQLMYGIADLPSREDWSASVFGPGNPGQDFFFQWKNYPYVLLRYQTALCAELTQRGFYHGRDPKVLTWSRAQMLHMETMGQLSEADQSLVPEFLGKDSYHHYHQTLLRALDPGHYSQHF